MESLGYNVKMRRIRRRLSIKELSEKSEVSRSYISELEENKHDNPSIKVLCQMCRILNCTPDDLIPKQLYIK